MKFIVESDSSLSSSTWTRTEDKEFELALVEFFPDDENWTPQSWEKIAARLPNKSAKEIEQHYNDLLGDVADIEARLIDLPPYVDYDDLVESCSLSTSKQQQQSKVVRRRTGIRWTDERQFLMGLEKYGEGDWKSISKNAVMTKTQLKLRVMPKILPSLEDAKSERQEN
ncbi:unnamed protein product [Camellia sinensis]